MSDAYNTPQSPWSYPRTLPRSWRQAAYTPDAEQPEQPPQQQPPGPQPEPPSDTGFDPSGRGGTFQNLPEPAPSQVDQRVPDGQQRPYQRFVSSATNRPPSEWSDPDWALKGAQGYPGVSPGPYMPQAQDMWGTVQSVISGLGQGGSEYVGGPARMAGQYAGQMSKAYVEGQLAGYRLNFERLKQKLAETAAKQDEELSHYKEVFAIFGPHKEGEGDKAVDVPGDPDRMRQELELLAQKYQDPTLQAALDNGGVAAAERVLATRDGHSQDANKILQQQKAQLEIEKLKIQIQKLKEGNPASSYEDAPDTDEETGDQAPEDQGGTQAPKAPGAEPPEGEPKEWPHDLLPPDEDQPAPAPQPPAPSVPTSTGGQQGAVTPPGRTQVAGGEAPGVTSDAPAIGVGAGAPTVGTQTIPGATVAPAISGGIARPNEPAAPLAQNPPASTETQERPKRTYNDGGPDNINQVMRPVPEERMPKGFNHERLDNAARFYLENGKLPYTSADKNPEHQIRNEAISRRASQMETAINRILDNKNLSPQQKLRLIDLVDPGMAAQVRGLLVGDPMPRASNSVYNRLLAQAAHRVDPNYTQTDADTRKKIKSDYTLGGYIGRVNANAATLAEAARAVVDAARGIDFSDNRVISAINQYIQNQTGDPQYTNFYIAWRNYTMEAVRLARRGTGAEADIQAGITAVPPIASRAQILGALQYDTRTAVASLTYNEKYWHDQNMPGKHMPGWDDDAMSTFDAIRRGDWDAVSPEEKVIDGKTYYKKGDHWYAR